MVKDSQEYTVPFYRPFIDEEEIRGVIDALKSGWLTMGKLTFQFEKAIADYVHSPFVTAVNSCTSAIHLVAHSIMKPREEAILSPLTFTSAANMIIHENATVKLVDIDPETLNITPGSVEEAITEKTSLIMPVHYAGYPLELDKFEKLRKRVKIHILEDAAHAIGTSFNGEKVGGKYTDFVAFSFYATKNMTTGEGGAIATPHEEYVERFTRLRLHGISKDAWKRYEKEGTWRYDVLEPGYKYNFTDFQAALGLAQLKRLDRFIELKREHVKQYAECIEKIDGIRIPQYGLKHSNESSWHLLVTLIDENSFGMSRDKLYLKLRERNIFTSVHYIPLYDFKYYHDILNINRKDFPVMEKYKSQLISLPLFPMMSSIDIEYVCKVLKDLSR